MCELTHCRAYGTVYKGVQRGSGNVFAIKVIDRLGTPEQQEELKKEIEILKKCTNKNIVSYYGCLTTPDQQLWVLAIIQLFKNFCINHHQIN
jgi:serine/threonine protein kinase